jgi:hypothetical protein
MGTGTLRRAHAEQRVTAVQNEYSLLWRGPEKWVGGLPHDRSALRAAEPSAQHGAGGVGATLGGAETGNASSDRTRMADGAKAVGRANSRHDPDASLAREPRSRCGSLHAAGARRPEYGRFVDPDPGRAATTKRARSLGIGSSSQEVMSRSRQRRSLRTRSLLLRAMVGCSERASIRSRYLRRRLHTVAPQASLPGKP